MRIVKTVKFINFYGTPSEARLYSDGSVRIQFSDGSGRHEVTNPGQHDNSVMNELLGK